MRKKLIENRANNSRTQYPDRKDHKEVEYNIETRTYLGNNWKMQQSYHEDSPVYL